MHNYYSQQLPVLCTFQNVTYTLVISNGGEEVKRVSKEFSYSSGYNGECIEELVTDGLEEGKEYSVRVSVDAGDSGNSSSDMNTFSRSSFLAHMHTVKPVVIFENNLG